MKKIIALYLFGIACLFLEPTYSLDNNDLLRQIHDLFFKLHAEIEQANRDLQQNVEKQLTQANDQIDTSFKTTGNDLTNSTSNGGIFFSKIGSSRIVQSGTDENGKPYYIEKQTIIDGDTRYRSEKILDPETKVFHEKKYKLNLTDPEAKEVLLSETK